MGLYQNWRSDISVFVRGMLMGIADVVPGVSGGTVALLTGIYPRLIGALASLNRESLGWLCRGQFGELIRRTDLRFLAILAFGIGVGLLVTIFSVVGLLQNDQTRPLVLAAFMGMILAATYLMYHRLRYGHGDNSPTKLHPGHWGWTGVGFSIALAITLSQQASAINEPSLGYLFFAGVIGISAMILPGVSGAMLLLLMGVYSFLVHLPSEILLGEQVLQNTIYLSVFAAGCATGLLTTTKVLKWLLQHWPIRITCFLLGLMIGAIPCLWPYQTNTTPDQPKLSLRVYENRLPDLTMTSDLIAIGIVLASAAIVMLLEKIARQTQEPSQTQKN